MIAEPPRRAERATVFAARLLQRRCDNDNDDDNDDKGGGDIHLLLFANAYTSPIPPKISPATNRPNQLFKWRGNQQIRYQQAGPISGDPVLLIHGLFVNSDHWRKTIKGLAEEGYNVYAIDLWGYGYSSKPPYDSPEAQAVNGENVRSPYNFFTWSELITDFSQDVIGVGKSPGIFQKKTKPVTLVSNSIGTSSALQAVMDKPDLYTGVCVVTPNFRELHSAEIPLPKLSMPIVRSVQKLLREKGQPLFDAAATPKTVKQILKEPYKIQSAIDDTLVDVLLDPLLLPGGSKVVFDTLSYSAGPLPDQQLDMFPSDKPVWISYGTKIHGHFCSQKVIAFDGIGHCPHDEAPELVNPFILEFLKRVSQ
ncbi:alpha/beta-hydrolase [Fragilariopsis cylindrus CCMP1102]|uniref:Alpha/beta-hydrolase n=1 Tax=Fragilariopsis cylindrus CCMP1102 TaxID=635003 RepID=A0A1E7EX13_9STRA|nr:alpha/beta-hydrolase [Fragilariopsis cylindrus CCMP1102]|eukprot:OEU10578.1 alpha/beta-hydrolase [Fragilariopsis cylindrus CCMP1102]